MEKKQLSEEEVTLLNSRLGLYSLLRSKKVNLSNALEETAYEIELKKYQEELIKLQNWVIKNDKKVVVLFEGRDAAGKGGAIRRITEYINPRHFKIVALNIPTEDERKQWFFQRYINELPKPGELVFFDRSWYNRAVVEPVNQFCTKNQYQTFMQQVPEFEHMLYEDNIEVIKFWFSISKEEQDRRFKARKKNPLKQWKVSPVDDKAQEHWELYTKYKEEMFSKTHTSYAPWVIVKANSKIRARLEAIRHVLNTASYAGKDKAAVNLHPDPNIILRFHRRTATED